MDEEQDIQGFDEYRVGHVVFLANVIHLVQESVLKVQYPKDVLTLHRAQDLRRGVAQSSGRGDKFTTLTDTVCHSGQLVS